MYFTLAIGAASRQACAALVTAAQGTDPRVMPIPGPVQLVWRAADGRTAVLHWGHRGAYRATGQADHAAASHAGTIWINTPGPGPAVLCARTGVTRVDPVYLAETPGAVVVCDRASWAAAVTGRLNDHDPVMVGAFLCLGYPMGAATPFRRVRALDGDRALRITGGRLTVARVRHEGQGGPASAGAASGGSASVGAALVEAVRPLGDAGVPVELSLTGGKDSRLIAAALVAARVPFRARTHGFASHPDVVIAGMIAARLGIGHTVTEPRPTATAEAPDQAEVLGRLRSAVLVSDGMLSAFENVGRPDPEVAAEPVQAGGHGGELLRGGYAQAAWRSPAPGRSRRVLADAAALAWSDAAATELFRRLTTRRLALLRPAAAAAYLAGLAPFTAALAAGPLRALDDFYLVNRAGRWSAAARQAYLIRSPLAQPFFADHVVRAARAVPLRQRMKDQLHREVLAALCPGLLGIPLAGSPWQGQTRTPRTVLAAGPGSAAAPDWRREYGEAMARFLRDYILDLGGAGPMFDIVRRQAIERLLRPPQADPYATWMLATLVALVSGDWLNAREPVTNQPKVARLAAAVPRLGLPEVQHADDERHDRPAESGYPQIADLNTRVAVGLQTGDLLRVEDGAFRRAVRLRAWRVVPVRGHDRVPDEGDVHGRRVEGEDALGPLRQRGRQRSDAVHDPAEVPPDPQQERDQLADVLSTGAEPGQDQRCTHIERGLQQQRRDEKKPVRGDRFPGPEHDREQHQHRQQQLLELHDHVGERQAGPRKVQRADQRDIRSHHRRADHDRPFGEGKYENPGDQVSDVIVDAAVGLEQDPENQVVDARVKQRRQHLPELAEPRFGIHRHITCRGIRDDEMPPLPHQPEV
jgi:hypothetical protein